jgi:hypothetical protein
VAPPSAAISGDGGFKRENREHWVRERERQRERGSVRERERKINNEKILGDLRIYTPLNPVCLF